MALTTVGIIDTCIKEGCSAFAKVILGLFGSVCIKPFFGEAPCGPLTLVKVFKELTGNYRNFFIFFIFYLQQLSSQIPNQSFIISAWRRNYVVRVTCPCETYKN